MNAIREIDILCSQCTL